MITESVLLLFFGIADALLDLLPTDPPPDFFANTTGTVAQLFSYADQLGSWVPWRTAGVCLAGVLAAIALGFAIKVVRMVVSLFTAGGGSAA